nr:MAG TPA: hypothetical protein [Caudoviricetes sp.]
MFSIYPLLQLYGKDGMSLTHTIYRLQRDKCLQTKKGGGDKFPPLPFFWTFKLIDNRR